MPEQGRESLDLGDGNGQFGMTKQPERIEAPDWRAKRDANATLSIGREGQPPVGDRQASWTRGLGKSVGTGDRHVGYVR